MRGSEDFSGPLFTVVALCFNHARFLHECLSSIDAQTCQDFQLIVTDDASRDESPGLIEAWLQQHRPDALFIRHERNRGLCATLNEVLAATRGQYIAMIATDDRWYPNRLQVHSERLATARTPPAVLFSDACIMDESGVITDASFIGKYRPAYVPRSGSPFLDLVDANFIPAMCATIQVRALRSVGGYDETLTYEDYDMWLRLAAKGMHFEFVGGTLADYRIVSTSLIRTTIAQPGANQTFTEFSIARKCLETGLLSASQQARFLATVERCAYALSLCDDARAAESLLYVGLRRRRPRLYALGVLSALGLRRSVLKRWVSKLGLGRR